MCDPLLLSLFKHMYFDNFYNIPTNVTITYQFITTKTLKSPKKNNTSSFFAYGLTYIKWSLKLMLVDTCNTRGIVGPLPALKDFSYIVKL